MSTSPELAELVAVCIERYLAEGESGVAALCAEHPQHAAALRRRMETLRANGMLEDAPPEFPERLGEFRLLRRLGSGGMGVVYLARQDSLGREVALKLVRPERLYFPGARERFRREVEAMVRLQHPGIVPVHMVGEAAGIPYYAMDRVVGISLAQVLEKLVARPPVGLSGADLSAVVAEVTGVAPGGGELAQRVFGGSWVEACIRVVHQAAEAIQHAHERGVLHRDLKPSNLMLTPAGRVVILDFGLATVAGEDRLTHTGSQMGSMPYLAPEQLRGPVPQTDARTDVYALGITLYELLTLRPAFPGEGADSVRTLILEGHALPPRQHNRAVPWDAETVCLKAMDRDPARRYATAAELAQDLNHLLRFEPIQAERPGPMLRARRWAQRHPARSTALVLGGLFLLLGPATLLLQQKLANDSIRAARDRAEVNYRRALRAVDRMLTRVGTGDLTDAPFLEGVRRKILEDAVEFYRGFLDDGSREPRVRVDTALAHLRLAHMMLALSRPEEAERGIAQAEQILAGLTADFPAEMDYVALGAIPLLLRSQSLRELGPVEGLPRVLDQMVRLHERLGGCRQQRAACAEHWLALLDEIASVQLALRRLPEAGELARRTLAEFERAAAERPTDPDLIAKVSDSRHRLARALMLQRQPEQALPEARAAVDILLRTPGPAAAADGPSHGSRLCKRYALLGDVLRSCRDWDGADQALTAALEVAARLVTEFAAYPTLRFHHAVVLRLRGTLRLEHRSASRPWRPDLEQCGEILERLIADLPRSKPARRELARTRINVASALLDDRDGTDSRASLERALDLAVGLVRDGPSAVDQFLLARVHGCRAWLEFRHGELDQAYESLRLALASRKAALLLGEEEPELRTLLRQQLPMMVQGFLRGGQLVAALETAVEHGGFATREDAQPALQAAQLLLHCARAASALDREAEAEASSSRPASSPAEAATLFERACAEAVLQLRRAVELGATDRAQLERDDAFRALRRRTDFMELVGR